MCAFIFNSSLLPYYSNRSFFLKNQKHQKVQNTNLLGLNIYGQASRAINVILKYTIILKNVSSNAKKVKVKKVKVVELSNKEERKDTVPKTLRITTTFIAEYQWNRKPFTFVFFYICVGLKIGRTR